MTQVIVRATAARWASDGFPGWIEVNLVDAAGQCHRLVDKVPIFTTANITASSAFPFELWLRAESEHVAGDTVLVRLVDGVETTRGVDLISMDADAVRWL